MNANVTPDVESDAFAGPTLPGLPRDDERFAVTEVRIGRRPFGRELLETVLLTLLLFFVVRGVVQNFVVEGQSMEPTLHNGQMLFVNKAAYYQWDTHFLEHLNPLAGADVPVQMSYLLGAPQRGDIIVLHAPNDYLQRDFIKRVIGLPEDRVQVRAEDGVYVNGLKLPEPYVHDTPDYNWPPAGSETVVPAGQLFVLGDNRRNSDDSHVFGFIKQSAVVGRAWFVYWPRESLGPLPHPTYK